MSAIRRPSAAELEAARTAVLPDLIAPGLRVLFCGINPSLYSAAAGQHFARPGNRFWPTLAASGFTPRRLHPAEQEALLALGCGITNVADRPTARADELSVEELRRGGDALRRKVLRHRPEVLAILGLGAYRIAFSTPKAGIGLQADTVGDSALWVLPNPSGLNAHFQLPDLARVFTELRRFAEAGA